MRSCTQWKHMSNILLWFKYSLTMRSNTRVYVLSIFVWIPRNKACTDLNHYKYAKSARWQSLIKSPRTSSHTKHFHILEPLASTQEDHNIVKMKLSSSIVLMLFIIGSVLMTESYARRCRGRVNGSYRNGVCVPGSVCPRGRLRRPSGFCPQRTTCCIGSLLRCPRNRRHFITLRADCRRGNDQGRLSNNAPVGVRCCRNAPPAIR